MFCPNCGKETKENDNFCRYCGCDLRSDNVQTEEILPHNEPQKTLINNDDEEFVLYDVQKHLMALVLPMFLIPLFAFYFWNIFLNTHSLLSWFIVIAILGLIIYPIARYKSDRLIVTTKFAHIKVGIINPVEIDIPIDKIDMLEISQTSMGRMLGYGMAAFSSNSERYDYGYIKFPEELQYLIDDPERFAHEVLDEAVV